MIHMILRPWIMVDQLLVQRRSKHLHEQGRSGGDSAEKKWGAERITYHSLAGMTYVVTLTANQGSRDHGENKV